MKSRLSKRATREVERIDARWRTNRPAASLMFLDELTEVLDLLETSPDIGVIFGSHGDRLMRRVLLERSRYYVYYVIEGDELNIVTVWGTARGRTPRLGRSH